MFEFNWLAAGQDSQKVVLRIHSRHGWLGRKVLTCGGQTVFRRGWFAGVETRFSIPGDGRAFRLRLIPVAGSTDWRPALFANGVELPETTGNAPPRIVPAPATLSVPVGLTYLLMLLVVVMSPQASKILGALYLHLDDRKLVLTVTDPSAPAGALAIEQTQLGPAVQGQPHSVQLEAVGGTPPYTWTPSEKHWPKGLSLDEDTGELTCTPVNPHDYAALVMLSDSTKPEGQTVGCRVTIAVRPATPPGPDWPRITTLSLSPATLGEPYEYSISFAGGLPPYAWSTVGKKRLPDGLTLDKDGGRIHGTPEAVGNFPLTIRVIDDSYVASRDIVPWIIPLVVTAVGLLGFVNMRKRGVLLYGLLIVLQAGCALAALLPISITALGLQIVLWLVGAAHLGRMQ